MRIWAFDQSPTVLYSGGVPNGEQRLGETVQTVWWFVFLSQLWSLCMQSAGTLVLQTRFHRADKDPIVQIEERNMENFKPVSRQRPEKAKQGAVRPYFCIKVPFSNKLRALLKIVLDLSNLRRYTDKNMPFLYSLCHGLLLFLAPKVCEQTQIL